MPEQYVWAQLSLQPAITYLSKKGRMRKELAKQWLWPSSVLLPHPLPSAPLDAAIRDNVGHGTRGLAPWPPA